MYKTSSFFWMFFFFSVHGSNLSKWHLKFWHILTPVVAVESESPLSGENCSINALHVQNILKEATIVVHNFMFIFSCMCSFYFFIMENSTLLKIMRTFNRIINSLQKDTHVKSKTSSSLWACLTVFLVQIHLFLQSVRFQVGSDINVILCLFLRTWRYMSFTRMKKRSVETGSRTSL